MKKFINKAVCGLLAMTLVFGAVSCSKDAAVEEPAAEEPAAEEPAAEATEGVITLEMPYATSGESLVQETMEFVFDAYSFDCEYTFENNVITMQVNSEDVPGLLTNVEEERDLFIDQYVSDGYVNSIEINETFTELNIDFKATTTQAQIEEVYAEYLGLAMFYQAFTGVPAAEFSLACNLFVDGTLATSTTVTQEIMIQS